ncbi:chromosomal replication initiator DnaA [Clostridioides difficile]|uniref:chromosomal replication initiator DnaA n=1 Tax=Clostridioides difficile TaxID=1496 RepID=UPI00202E82CD|nr:chromosomal replication initiator DnaA [Clostridioides difficile]MCM0737882.1 chromosomal replication initiator DnaA [Clostridioides difficile]
MAKYRILQANFWDDAFVLDLTPEEKYFYNYLLTNGRASQCGCYELPYKIMEMQTGYNRETVEKLIKRFIEYGKIKYDSETKEILIINWSKHNFSKSPKVRTCILKEVENIKNKEFREYMYRVCIDYGYPIDTVSIDYREKEKQQQKEKRKKKKQQQKEKEEKSLVVVDNIKRYFNLESKDIEKIVDVFIHTGRGIDYLEEKLMLVKNTENVKSVTGYLIKALKEDYKLIPSKNNKNKFRNFDETFTKYTSDELDDIIKKSQKEKFGVGS